jgi:organic hydroperoxide reductase OsmC/OhrA
MVVTASRQPTYRPETIRTRLARFLPRAAAAGWAVAWSAQTERSDEISSEEELAAADHLGCFGAALSHALAKADISASHLQLAAETPPSTDGSPQSITIEIRAQIAGPALDRSIIEGIARRADTSCPVWKGLATEGRVRFVAVLEEATAEAHHGKTAPSSSARPQRAASGRSMPSLSLGGMPEIKMPKWLTPKMAILLVAAAVVLVFRLLPM